MAKERFSWLIKRKSFVQLVGAEYHLLKKSGSNSILKFYIAAVIIVLILLLTICSIFYATEMLFRIPQVEALLAGFISLLFVFIYIFLLNTFSKQVLIDKKEKEEISWWKKIRLANIIRIGFVAFMAFLIAKPVEIFVFRERLGAKVEAYKSAMFNDYRGKIESLNNTDVQKIKQSLAFYKEQLSNYHSQAISEEIKHLTNQLSAIQISQTDNLHVAKQRIEQSDFLLYRIQTVSHYALSWMICASIIFLFLIPGFLIYSISTNDTYYKLKHDWERRLISEEHSAFCKWYTEIFKENFNLDRTCYSVFEDPPFNEIRKAQPSFQSQSDFTKKFSGE